MRVGVALCERPEARLEVARLETVELPEIEVLVLHDVGQLMDQGDAQRRRHLGASDRDAFRLGVVVRERAVVLERAHRSDEVDVTVDEAEGPHLALDLFELRDILVGELVPIGHAVAVLLLGQEVDRDRVVVEQAALVLDELDEVGDAGVPVGRLPSGAVVGEDTDAGDRSDDQRATDSGGDPPIAHPMRRRRRGGRRGRRRRGRRRDGRGKANGRRERAEITVPTVGPHPRADRHMVRVSEPRSGR